MTPMEDLRSLVEYPMERLDAEYKDWLDLSANPGRATLAKAAIALANHGGGFIILGFAEDGASLKSSPPPTNLPQITQDAVNNAISRYAEPSFQCEMHIERRHDTGVQHPIIAIPRDLAVPVMSRRDHDRVIQQNRCYIRKPGPRSEEPTTQSEWRALLNRCVRANRDEMLDAIRAIVTGQVGASDPVPTVADELRDFCAIAQSRWQELSSGLADSSAGRFLDGYYEIGISLVGAVPAQSLNEIERRIEAAGRISLTGWPPFLVMNSRGWHPYPYEEFIEAWLGRPADKRAFDDPSHADFWRISQNGQLYLIRGYVEDEGRPQQGPPGSSVNVVIPVWRIGETLLFASRFAEAFDGVEQIAVRCNFTGLAGRHLVSTSLDAPFIETGFVSRTDAIPLETQATVQQVQDNLAEIVHNLLSPFYEQFGFYQLPFAVVQAQLQRMQSNR